MSGINAIERGDVFTGESLPKNYVSPLGLGRAYDQGHSPVGLRTHLLCPCQGIPIAVWGSVEFPQCDSSFVVPTSPIFPQSEGESQKGRQAGNSATELSESMGGLSVGGIVYVDSF